MKKKANFSIGIFFLIVVSIILIVISVSFTCMYNINLRGQTSYAILELPNSNSPILTEISNNTYLMNEEVNASIIFYENIKISNFSINGIEQNVSNILNSTLSFPLDTLIDNGNSKQTKVISIHGNIIDEQGNDKDLVIPNKNYQIISNLEESYLEITTKTNEKVDKANNLALWAIIISAFLFVINQVINFYLWSKKK